MARTGRPLKFKTVEEFQEKVDDYFARTPWNQQTITGLALHLDTFRDVLCDYGLKDDFSNAVRTAKQRVEHAYELSLRTRGNAGDIFGLKNFGWTDQTQIDHTTKGKEMPAPILGGLGVHPDNSNSQTGESQETD